MPHDFMTAPGLRADIAAVADLLDHTADKQQALPADGLRFVAASLRQLATNAGAIEASLAFAQRRLVTADARIEALTIPDYLRRTREEIAIREGRAAGVVVDLRDVFAREDRKGGAA